MCFRKQTKLLPLAIWAYIPRVRLCPQLCAQAPALSVLLHATPAIFKRTIYLYEYLSYHINSMIGFSEKQKVRDTKERAIWQTCNLTNFTLWTQWTGCVYLVKLSSAINKITLLSKMGTFSNLQKTTWANVFLYRNSMLIHITQCVIGMYRNILWWSEIAIKLKIFVKHYLPEKYQKCAIAKISLFKTATW